MHTHAGDNSQYICNDSMVVIIDFNLLCDGQDDCPDGDDELNILCQGDKLHTLL